MAEKTSAEMKEEIKQSFTKLCDEVGQLRNYHETAERALNEGVKVITDLEDRLSEAMKVVEDVRGLQKEATKVLFSANPNDWQRAKDVVELLTLIPLPPTEGG